jgi:cytochrome c-type biogenesis protein CcmF
LTSVHAFAVDPARGAFILVILAAAIGGSLILFAVRGPSLGEGARYDAVSREGGLLVNNALLVAACFTVFIGTFYPLFVDVLNGDKISVGAPYFNAVFLPFMALILLIVAPASALAWKTGKLGVALKRLWPAFAASLAAFTVALSVASPRSVIAASAVLLATLTGAGVALDFARRIKLHEKGAGARVRGLPRSYFAMCIAHVGLAVAAFGIIGASAWKLETITYAQIGDAIPLGRFQATLKAVTELDGPNYVAEAAHFDLTKDGRSLGAVVAERRFYPVRGMQTTEAGIRTSPGGDIYITIGEHQEGRGWVVRAWRHPLVIWMWVGAAMMAIGGAVGAGAFYRRPRVMTAPFAARTAAAE